MISYVVAVIVVLVAAVNSTGRSICVHILPIIYKLTQTLFEGLSEHLLVCYTSIINEYAIGVLTEERRKDHYNDLVQLVQSSSDKKHDCNDDDKYDIINMLIKFNVGTERPKFYATETNPAKHGIGLIN
jgi:hypothetical protein